MPVRKYTIILEVLSELTEDEFGCLTLEDIGYETDSLLRRFEVEVQELTHDEIVAEELLAGCDGTFFYDEDE